jgi:hypothetical protein
MLAMEAWEAAIMQATIPLLVLVVVVLVEAIAHLGFMDMVAVALGFMDKALMELPIIMVVAAADQVVALVLQ